MRERNKGNMKVERAILNESAETNSIINDLQGSKFLDKHRMHTSWLSGSSTHIPPITEWGREYRIQLVGNKNIYREFIDEFVSSHSDELEDGYFVKGDGSSPSELVFVKRDTKTIKEDTIKTKSGKWVNKGDTGETHGTFKTKKAADEQRKAMFTNRKKGAKWGESLKEEMKTIKLTKDNRDIVKIGTKMYFDKPEEIHTVTNVWETNRPYTNQKGLAVTLQDNYGRNLYGYPISKLYGANIIIEESLRESVEDNIIKEVVRTPRGTFELYGGSFKDFTKEDDAEDWRLWFDHYYPDDAAWEDVEKWYKIYHNPKTNHAVAILYKELKRD